MSHAVVASMLRHVQAPCSGIESDAELLDEFVRTGDGRPFEALVLRHGPMVLGVCQGALRNIADAEDAFQAAFLVLARRAASAPSDALPGWLHGVALRTARHACRLRARRRMRESSLDAMPEPAVDPVLPDADLREQLGSAIEKLSDRLRSAVVLCELLGVSRGEAAQRLGVPEGTLSSRLAAARKALARRLKDYAPLAVPLALPVVSPMLVNAAVQHARLVSLDPSAAVVSSVGTTANGVIFAMNVSRIRPVVIAAMLVIGLACSAVVSSTSAQIAGPKTLSRTNDDTDELFLRRTSLDLRGTLPSSLEMHFFKSSTDPDKRKRAIDLMIAERQSAQSAQTDKRAKTTLKQWATTPRQNQSCQQCHSDLPEQPLGSSSQKLIEKLKTLLNRRRENEAEKDLEAQVTLLEFLHAHGLAANEQSDRYSQLLGDWNTKMLTHERSEGSRLLKQIDDAFMAAPRGSELGAIRSHEQRATALKQWVKWYPSHPELLSALQRLAQSQMQSGDISGSDVTRAQIVTASPGSPEADAARRELQARAFIGLKVPVAAQKIDGGNVDLTKELKNTTVVVAFWLSEHGPKMVTMLQQRLNAQHARSPRDRVVVITYCMDVETAKARQFLAENKVPGSHLFWSATQPKARQAVQYGLDRLPAVFELSTDANGLVTDIRRD